MMTQDDIRRRYADAKDKIDMAKIDYEVALAAPRGIIGALQKICKHPNKHQTSCMGDLGWSCPDCGWSV